MEETFDTSTAQGGSTFWVDGIKYEITSDNTIAVVGVGEYIMDVDIPESVTYNEITYIVDTIGKSACRDCKNGSSDISSDCV